MRSLSPIHEYNAIEPRNLIPTIYPQKPFSPQCFEQSHKEQRVLFCDADILWFREKAQCFFAAFAADAALFHAAKGDAQVAHEPAIHPYRAGVNSLSDTVCAAHVLCPDARS